jgi:hypothetical protein
MIAAGPTETGPDEPTVTAGDLGALEEVAGLEPAE